MRGERFESPEAAVETFRTLISEITALEWKKCFENWFELCKNLSILRANTSKNNKAIYRILHVFFSYCLQKLFQQPTYFLTLNTNTSVLVSFRFHLVMY